VRWDGDGRVAWSFRAREANGYRTYALALKEPLRWTTKPQNPLNNRLPFASCPVFTDGRATALSPGQNVDCDGVYKLMSPKVQLAFFYTDTMDANE